jgi:hypothetical protein
MGRHEFCCNDVIDVLNPLNDRLKMTLWLPFNCLECTVGHCLGIYGNVTRKFPVELSKTKIYLLSKAKNRKIKNLVWDLVPVGRRRI